MDSIKFPLAQPSDKIAPVCALLPQLCDFIKAKHNKKLCFNVCYGLQSSLSGLFPLSNTFPLRDVMRFVLGRCHRAVGVS